MVIDPENPGNLTLSTGAYDTKVAGFPPDGADDARADFTFGPPTPLEPPINRGPQFADFEGEWYPCVPADGLELYVTSDRPGGSGSGDLWVGTRESEQHPWGIPVNLGTHIDTAAWDGGPSLSADGLSLHFSSARPGGHGGMDIYVATRPSVDEWGQEEPACDIGPSPLGDGIVDVQDPLAVFDHLGEEVDDPTLVAHWALDEMEGAVAEVGDLVDGNSSTISFCYSTGSVNGGSWGIHGLVGSDAGSIWMCFWDMDTSGHSAGYRGIGLRTADMQSAATFLDVGWDFIDETENGTGGRVEDRRGTDSSTPVLAEVRRRDRRAQRPLPDLHGRASERPRCRAERLR